MDLARVVTEEECNSDINRTSLALARGVRVILSEITNEASAKSWQASRPFMGEYSIISVRVQGHCVWRNTRYAYYYYYTVSSLRRNRFHGNTIITFVATVAATLYRSR